ncbi:hypothetical protein [Sphingomonas oligophenolica]|uniref:hypothetical protein n=1 Tax=Sphingomonas oligophenolica TaxID=301154 RepID=UPI00112CB7D8|nr:hypothetical protein [Sphingomonas oligophenolica]
MTSSPLAAPSAASDLIWLLGQPHLNDYLRFVETKVIGGDTIAVGALVEEWRRANDCYYDLESQEAGLADTIGVVAIEPSLASRAAAVMATSAFRETFNGLPASIAKVELDKLVVAQIHVEHGHRFEDVAARGLRDDAVALFDLCLPIDAALPEVTIARLGEHHYRFSSPSTDLRAHKLRLLPPLPIGDTGDFGPWAAMLGLGIGYSANLLSGVRSGSRILLQNGYHRAYALRAMGVTHAYCVIEEVTRKDELAMIASSRVTDDPEFYFAAKRPPLLRDFFDPIFAKRLAVLPIVNEIEVTVNVTETMATRRR